jgi:hypothetical protein
MAKKKNTYVQKIDSLLNEILDIVKKIPSNYKPENDYEYRNVGSELFSKIFELGLYYSDFKRYKEHLEPLIYRVDVEIIKLLAENSDWLSKFFGFFILFYLNWGHDTRTAYMIRSGIEIFSDFWKVSLAKSSNHKLKTILLEGSDFIDEILKRWIKNPDNWVTEKPKNIPNSHWWYVVSPEKPKSDQQISLDIFGNLIDLDSY